LELGIDLTDEVEAGFTVDLAFVLAIGFAVNLVGGDMGFDCAYVLGVQTSFYEGPPESP
jgi:hypothetical protein